MPPRMKRRRLQLKKPRVVLSHCRLHFFANRRPLPWQLSGAMIDLNSPFPFSDIQR